MWFRTTTRQTVFSRVIAVQIVNIVFYTQINYRYETSIGLRFENAISLLLAQLRLVMYEMSKTFPSKTWVLALNLKSIQQISICTCIRLLSFYYTGHFL